MKLRFLLTSFVAFCLWSFAHAADVADLARAQLLFAKVMNGLDQAKKVAAAAGTVTATPVAPKPLADKSGKFFSPYNADGQLTAWAQKALAANVGAAVGAKAGEKAGTMAASRIPLAGGLLAMGAKKKGKELGALAAVGGAGFVKESSSQSFNSLQDLALNMHLTHAGGTDYVKAFAAAMAIYPDLEKTYESTINGAFGVR